VALRYALISTTQNICSVEGCERKYYARGLCKIHYGQFWYNKDQFELKIYPTKCSVSGCDKPYMNSGYCNTHLLRMRRHGDPLYSKIDKSVPNISKDPEYKVWDTMKQRCTNTNNHKYKDYGARGITYEPRWAKYNNFISDMGHRPTPKHQLERVNNNEGYSKNNCIWALPVVQAMNRRSNHLITINGETKHIIEWARIAGITHATIIRRINWGWPPEKLILPRQKPYSTK
jgi:hypothetical protein